MDNVSAFFSGHIWEMVSVGAVMAVEVVLRLWPKAMSVFRVIALVAIAIAKIFDKALPDKGQSVPVAVSPPSG